MTLKKALELAEDAVHSGSSRKLQEFLESWVEFLREQHEHYDAHAKLTEISVLISESELENLNPTVRAIQDILDREKLR